MSQIKNGGLDQYGTEPFERQQTGTAGVERVNSCTMQKTFIINCHSATDRRPVTFGTATG